MERSRFAVVNITWNPYGWRSPYTNPKAGHAYVKKHPGHESLNFKFDKKNLDDEKHVFGYIPRGQYLRRLIEPGIIFFFTRNYEIGRNEIVGVYGNASMIEPKSTKIREFRNGKLWSTMKAEREKSILFPIHLDARGYYPRGKGKRWAGGQAGIAYIKEKLAARIINDEIQALDRSGGMRKDELDKLYSIREMITGEKQDAYMNDEEEQEEIEKDEKNRSIDEIVRELLNTGRQNPATITVNGKIRKRYNETIVRLKILHGFKCQMCGCKIQKKDGFYIEAAHIVAKSDGGHEVPENLLILCPNHHKEFDHGSRTITKHTKKQITFQLNDIEHNIRLDPRDRQHTDLA